MLQLKIARNKLLFAATALAALTANLFFASPGLAATAGNVPIRTVSVSSVKSPVNSGLDDLKAAISALTSSIKTSLPVPKIPSGPQPSYPVPEKPAQPVKPTLPTIPAVPAPVLPVLPTIPSVPATPQPPSNPEPDPDPGTDPVPVPNSGNLIANSSLETADPADPSLPQSWFQGSWGSNAPVFTYPIAGYDGSKAAKVEITQYTDGDAKWYFAEVPVKENYKYVFSDYYLADVPTKVTVQYNTGSGFTYAEIGSPAAVSGWTRFTADIVVPPGVKMLTVFHSISAKGSLSVDNYSLIEKGTSSFTQGMVSLNFDDGWLSAYQNALPILDKSGLKTTQYIISGSFNDPQYVNPQQVLNMQAAGHEIGAHSKSHPYLSTLTPEQMQQEIAGSKSELEKIGVKSVKTFAYPFGDSNSIVENEVIKAGFIGARLADTGYNAKESDRYKLTVQSIEKTTTFAQVKSWIDEAEKNKTWVIVLIHKVDNSNEEYSTTPAMIQQIADYLVQRKTKVVTNEEGIRSLSE